MLIAPTRNTREAYYEYDRYEVYFKQCNIYEKFFVLEKKPNCQLNLQIGKTSDYRKPLTGYWFPKTVK